MSVFWIIRTVELVEDVIFRGLLSIRNVEGIELFAELAFPDGSCLDVEVVSCPSILHI
jgi:hypothetical protein